MQYKGHESTSYNNSSSPSVDTPSTDSGDVVLLFLWTAENYATIGVTPPSGFSLIHQQGLGSSGVFVYQKIAGGSEPSSYTCTCTLDGSKYISCYVAEGVFGGLGEISGTDSSSLSWAAPDVLVENKDSLLVTFCYGMDLEAGDRETRRFVQDLLFSTRVTQVCDWSPGVGQTGVVLGACYPTDWLALNIVLEGVEGGYPLVKPPTGLWSLLLPIDPEIQFTQGCALSPAPNNNYIYVAIASPEGDTDGSGVWRSTDFGSTWTQVSGPGTGKGPGQPVCVRVNPANPLDIRAADGVRGDTNGYWSSSDGGETWTMPAGFISATASLIRDGYFIGVNPADWLDQLFAFHNSWPGYGDRSGLLRTLDGGVTWSVIEPPTAMDTVGGTCGSFLFDPSSETGDANTILLSTQSDGQYRCTDGGANPATSWTKVTTDAMAHGGHQICYSDSGVLFVSSEHGILKSDDNGASFTQVGPDTAPYLSVFRDEDNIFALQQSAGLVLKAPFTVEDEEDWARLGNQFFISPEGAVVGGGAFAFQFDPVLGRIYGTMQANGFWMYQKPDYVNFVQVETSLPGMTFSAEVDVSDAPAVEMVLNLALPRMQFRALLSSAAAPAAPTTARAGLVARLHGAADFQTDPLGAYALEGIMPGGTFSAIVVLRIRDLAAATSSFVAGTFGMVGESSVGWSVQRQSLSAGKLTLITQIGPNIFPLSFDLPDIGDRTVFFGLTHAAGLSQAFLNGAEFARSVATPAPLEEGTFRIGGGASMGGSPDYINVVAYYSTPLSASQMTSLWNRYRRYGLLDLVLPDYLYDGRTLQPQGGPLVAPSTWVNTGLEEEADLVWEGDPATLLLFEDDPHPSYAPFPSYPNDTVFAAESGSGLVELDEEPTVVQALTFLPQRGGAVRIAWSGNLAYDTPSSGANGIRLYLRVNGTLVPDSERLLDATATTAALIASSTPVLTEAILPLNPAHYGTAHLLELVALQTADPSEGSSASVVGARSLSVFQVG